MDKIYVKGLDRQITIREFLKKFFLINKSSYSSSSLTTYFDKEYTKRQCTHGRMRSFDDLLIIVETYYPSITPKKLMHLLLTTQYKTVINNKDNILIPRFSNCSTMKRIRITYNYCSIQFIENYYNYSIICNTYKYNSLYSWKDLLNMLNINNQKDLNNYINKHKKILCI